MLRCDGRLTTPQLAPILYVFRGFIRFVAECEFALRHFSIELESGAAVSTVHNPAR
jgi:hypothetical protein